MHCRRRSCKASTQNWACTQAHDARQPPSCLGLTHWGMVLPAPLWTQLGPWTLYTHTHTAEEGGAGTTPCANSGAAAHRATARCPGCPTAVVTAHRPALPRLATPTLLPTENTWRAPHSSYSLQKKDVRFADANWLVVHGCEQPPGQDLPARPRPPGSTPVTTSPVPKLLPAPPTWGARQCRMGRVAQLLPGGRSGACCVPAAEVQLHAPSTLLTATKHAAVRLATGGCGFPALASTRHPNFWGLIPPNDAAPSRCVSPCSELARVDPASARAQLRAMHRQAHPWLASLLIIGRHCCHSHGCHCCCCW